MKIPTWCAYCKKKNLNIDAPRTADGLRLPRFKNDDPNIVEVWL